MGVVGDAPVRSGVGRDSPACTGLGATGEVVATGVVVAGAGADDEDTDDSEVSPGHGGVTTQSMNCQTPATSTMSSNTVAIA
jgi:hypothetical protein